MHMSPYLEFLTHKNLMSLLMWVSSSMLSQSFGSPCISITLALNLVGAAPDTQVRYRFVTRAMRSVCTAPSAQLPNYLARESDANTPANASVAEASITGAGCYKSRKTRGGSSSEHERFKKGA